MPNNAKPELGLFLNILQTLEAIQAPYMIIGAFAATLYGISRVTYDIDIVVDLDDTHIDALAAAYPLPNYYADPYQMRDSIARGIMFNIIDSRRGEKADLVPLSMERRYRTAFRRRVRQSFELPDGATLAVWCARPEDVILGKLMAWQEGGSRRHETDIFEMVAFAERQRQQGRPTQLDLADVTQQVQAMQDPAVTTLWETILNRVNAE